jgi:hypothetical protein
MTENERFGLVVAKTGSIKFGLWTVVRNFWTIGPCPVRFFPPPDFSSPVPHTDKKENQSFLIYKEIQKGSVAKSYMTNGLLIYG